MKIGFIGLGSMGGAMALHLIGSGNELIVYNRTRKKAEPLVAKGARLAKTPGEAAAGDIVITMLADDAAVEGAVFDSDGILKSLKPGGVHVSMSTISVALSRRLAEAHEAAGQLYVAAPVFGRPEAAAAMKLFIVAAGPARAIEICQPVFEAIGQRSFHFGEDAPVANLIKLSGNFLIASVIEGLAEAFALTGKAGVAPEAYLDLLTSTLFAAPVYKTYGGLIASGKFKPAGFSATLGYKDVSLVLDAAKELKVPMSFASELSDRFLTLIATGRGELDWSALGGLARHDAGEPSALPR